MSSSPQLPSSPAARAFFAALDVTAGGDKAAGPATSLVQRRIQTLGWRNRYSQHEYHPVTVNGLTFSVQQVQGGEIEGTYGTGATVWPAAVVLLKYLERHADVLLKDKRIVDLGAGTGITSTAAALLGAKEVICTDGEPNVVQLGSPSVQITSLDNLLHSVKEISQAGVPAEMRPNSNATIRGCPVHVQEYWWGSGTIQGGNYADIVLVADCVLPKLYPIGPLVDAIDELLGCNPNAMAILSYEYRYFQAFDPGEEFRRLCVLKRLQVENIPSSEQDPIYSVEDVELWRVKRSI